MVTFRPGTTPEEVGKVMDSLFRIQQQIDDFFELADTIESENPEIDAWKAVFGVDNPAFDKNKRRPRTKSQDRKNAGQRY